MVKPTDISLAFVIYLSEGTRLKILSQGNYIVSAHFIVQKIMLTFIRSASLSAHPNKPDFAGLFCR